MKLSGGELARVPGSSASKSGDVMLQCRQIRQEACNVQVRPIPPHGAARARGSKNARFAPVRLLHGTQISLTLLIWGKAVLRAYVNAVVLRRCTTYYKSCAAARDFLVAGPFPIEAT